jgi:hypothetical protein
MSTSPPLDRTGDTPVKPWVDGDASFPFTAESFDVALEGCRNVTRLTLDGNVPDNLEIKAASVVNLTALGFTNIPNITEFRVLDIMPECVKFFV